MIDGADEHRDILKNNSDSSANANQTRPTSRLYWLVGPVGSLVSLLVGIIGLGFGIVSYFSATSKPELSYFQQPVHAILLRAGEVSRLSVTYNDKSVTSDITATQIAIWNAGTKVIRADDVLEPISLKVSEQTPILEAKVRYVTREVIGFQVGEIESEISELPLKFRIFEPGDGVILQLIYAGQPGIEVAISGVIVGQDSIRRAKILRTKDEKDYTPRSTVYRIMDFGLILIIGFVLMAAISIPAIIKGLNNLRNKELRTRARTFSGIILLAIGLIGLSMLASFVQDAMTYSFGPPFDF